MKAPRVLALTHSLSGVDGVGRYAVGTLRELAPLCAGIEVFIGRGHRGFAEDMPHDGITVYPTLPTGHFPFMPLPRLAWVLANGLPNLVRAARRAHLVHSLADYPMGLIAAVTGALAGRPVIVSGHGTYSVAPFSQRVHRTLITWMYARADRFLMGADFALAQVRRVTEAPRAEVVPYGCAPTAYDAWAARDEQPGVPGPYVLCVGEVKQRKGYHTSVPAFLTAWRRRPELHYAVVGRVADEDSYHAALVAQVEEAGASGHVHFLGNVSEARKVALMRGARAFLLTPVQSDEGGFEAFGLVYLEAGAAGTAAIGVLDSGAEDAIEDGVNGFLRRRDDLNGLAEALVRLVDDPALAARMGAAGRARAEGQTWRAAAERVREIYGEVLGGEFAWHPGDGAPASRDAPAAAAGNER